MVQTFAKSRNYAILGIVLIIAIIAVGANSNLVSADPCIAQLNYPVMPTGYSYSNIQVVVPMSATCSTYYGSQLYATGNAYDVTSNTGLGSVSTVLQSPDGGTTFNGQLGFNLPPSTQGHTVQLSVSIYNGQYGNQITTTSETIQVGTGNQLQYQQITTTTVTQAAPISKRVSTTKPVSDLIPGPINLSILTTTVTPVRKPEQFTAPTVPNVQIPE